VQRRETPLEGVVVLEPRVHADSRGFFLESYNARDFESLIGRRPAFVQENHSRSTRGVLRGLHYQLPQTQAKLVRVARGEILDVAVDLRQSSATFGQSVCERLSDQNLHELWIPEGFAHGFAVLSDVADVIYQTTEFYAPDHERCLLWNDPELAIPWPKDLQPIVSDKDRHGMPLSAAPLFP
jgi:dTDP-4-dehydrorhamnose 3,5-epimerase